MCIHEIYTQSLTCPKTKHFNFPKLCSCNSILLVWRHKVYTKFEKKRWNFVSNKNKNTNWIANTFLSKNWVNEWRDKTEVRLLNEKEKTFSQSMEGMRFIYGIIKKSEKKMKYEIVRKTCPMHLYAQYSIWRVSHSFRF